MKNVLTVLFCLFAFTGVVNAQFKLTKEGFIENKTNKDFYVMELKEFNQKDLFDKILIHTTAIYNSSKDVVSKVDPEIITISGFQNKAIKCKGLMYDIAYTLTMKFKDGKIRFDAPTFECSTFYNKKPYKIVMQGSNMGFGKEVKVGLFKKNGEISTESGVVSLESFFNNLIASFTSSINELGYSEDW